MDRLLSLGAGRLRGQDLYVDRSDLKLFRARHDMAALHPREGDDDEQAMT